MGATVSALDMMGQDVEMRDSDEMVDSSMSRNEEFLRSLAARFMVVSCVCVTSLCIWKFGRVFRFTVNGR